MQVKTKLTGSASEAGRISKTVKEKNKQTIAQELITTHKCEEFLCCEYSMFCDNGLACCATKHSSR